MKISLRKITGRSTPMILPVGTMFLMNSECEGAKGFSNANKLRQQVQSQKVITRTAVHGENKSDSASSFQKSNLLQNNSF